MPVGKVYSWKYGSRRLSERPSLLFERSFGEHPGSSRPRCTRIGRRKSRGDSRRLSVYSVSLHESPCGRLGLPIPDRTLAEASSAKQDDTGHERDAETSLHYAGARYYMSALGRWPSPDPLADKYPAHSPFTYTLNNPINAVDPDGRVVIFVNGHKSGSSFGELLTNSGPCCQQYWGRFARNMMSNFPAGERSRFYDGTVGGGSVRGRQVAGQAIAAGDFRGIMKQVRQEQRSGLDGSVKIFSHSKGSAFATGMITGLLQEAARTGVEQLRIAYHVAIEPFQASSLEADVQTYQISSFDKSSLADVFLGNTRIERAELIPEGQANRSGNPGHSILDYSADRIFQAVQNRETEVSSFIRDAVEAGASFSVIE